MNIKKHKHQIMLPKNSGNVSDKSIQHITAAITFMQLALMSMEEVKHTIFYQKQVKMRLNPAIKELIKVEKEYFDELYNADEKITSALSENIFLHFENIYKHGFINSVVIGNIINAFYENEKSITGIAKKILKEKFKDE